MKQKFKIALIFLTFFGYGSYAQESMIDDINYATLDKYIQAAKINFPRKKIFDTNVERAKTGVTAANLSYLDFLTASYYYRPDNKTAIDQTNPYSVNGFQFGATINIGVFLQKPSMTKKAKAELKIAKLEDQEYETTLTNEVKKRYYTYLRLLKDLKIKTQNCQDNSSVVDNLKNKYEKGETQLEAYNYARMRSAEANSSKLQSETDYLVAKDMLEEIIGQKLSDIK